MDSNNLATVFAPNILHCIKPGSSRDTSGDRPEDRIDVINVVRTLIDNYQGLYIVPAELLDEVYVHLMDSHPDILDQLLNKRDAIATADEYVSACWWCLIDYVLTIMFMSLFIEQMANIKSVQAKSNLHHH